MAEYSRLAKGSFTSTGAAKFINLPFQPDYVELTNFTAWATPANHGVPFAKWDAAYSTSTTLIQVFNATPVLLTDSVSTNGISVFSGGTLMQYGATQQVVASTKGATTSFQVTGHGYAVGDVVIFEGLYSTQFTAGMPQMSGIPFSVTTVTDANNFVVTWNSNNSNYTNLAASPAGATVKKVLYPFLYEPGVSYINALTLSSTTTVVTTTPHDLESGQEVAFRIPTLWGPTQLNSLPNVLIPGQAIYGLVQSITDNFTFVVNINSTGYTAFTTAISVANTVGLTPPQVLAIGDLNTGGISFNGGDLYPSPQFPSSTNRSRTINGPAIRGAYVNNTSQGFLVGAGVGVTDTSAVLVGANTNKMYWRAILHDVSGL